MVTRRTTPRSGFALLFRVLQVRRRRPPAACPDGIFLCRGRGSGLHHTRMEALSPVTQRWQSHGAVVLCGLATSRGPRPVLCHGVAERARAPGRARCGGGAAPLTRVRRSPQAQEPERAAKQPPRAPGDSADGLLRVQRRREPGMAAHDTPAAPRIVQCGGRFSRAAPVPVEALLSSEHRVTLEPVRDGPSQLVGQDGQGLARARLFLQAGPVLLAHGLGPQKQARGFRDGPWESGMAQLGARGAIPLARRVLRTLHQPARRGAILAPGAASKLMHRIPQAATRNRAAPRHGVAPVAGVRVGRLCRFAARRFQGVAPAIIVVQQRQVDGETLRHRRLGPPRGAAVAGGCGGDCLPQLGPVGLAGGLLDLGQQFRPLAHERPAPPSQIPRGAPLGGVDLRLGAPAAAPQDGKLLGVEPVVCGRAAGERCHREGVSQDKRHPVTGAEVGPPLPGEETFAAHDQLFPVGCHGRHNRVRPGGPRALAQELPVAVHETHGHGAGMQIDAAVKWGRCGIEAPEVSSSLASGDLPTPAVPPWSAAEGTSSSIIGMQATAYSVRCAPASSRA